MPRSMPYLHSTDALPPDYRRVAGVALEHNTVGGWLAHKNPNGTLTIVIYAFDPQTGERNFNVRFRWSSRRRYPIKFSLLTRSLAVPATAELPLGLNWGTEP
jgi:hypothetical protein